MLRGPRNGTRWGRITRPAWGVVMWTLLLAACTQDPAGLGPADPSPTSEPTTPPPPTTPEPARCEAVEVLEGEAALQGRPVAHASVPACAASLHATAGAAGSVLSVHVAPERDAWVSAVDPGGHTLLEDTRAPGGRGTELELTVVVSGEVLITVRPVDERPEPWAVDVATGCVSGCELPFTRYPILLMHGLSGSDTVFGEDYFYRVTDTLEAAGIEVASPGVAAFDDSTARSFEWSAHVDDLLARGHRRVNLFGHSQGGIDARVLASPAGLDRGDMIASVTTFGTPHRGTPIADTVLWFFDGGLVDEAAFDVAVAVFSAILGLQADDPAFVPAMRQLSEATMAEQDVLLVDHPATWYGSWIGHSCGILEPLCISRRDGEVVDVLLGASYLLIWPADNDGLVPTSSQTHGVELGSQPADHADEIGQISDDHNEPFDHLAFYLAEVERLEALGF